MHALGIVVALSFLVSTVERVPLSPKELQRESTHVVTGVVKAIYHRDVETTLYGKGTVETHYLFEIEVDAVEKGAGFGKGDIVYGRCWRLKKPGAAGLVPGPSGHFNLSKEGETVRAFLAQGRYGPTGQTDNGLSIVYPNGLEKQELRK